MPMLRGIGLVRGTAELASDVSSSLEVLLRKFSPLFGYGPESCVKPIPYGTPMEKTEEALQSLDGPGCVICAPVELANWWSTFNPARKPKRPVTGRKFPMEIDHMTFRDGVLVNTAQWDAEEAWKATMAMVGATSGKKGE